MKFQWLPASRMVRVTFDRPIPDLEELDKYFSLCGKLTKDGKWSGLECYPDEWESYMRHVIKTLTDMPNQEPTIEMLREATEDFAEFMYGVSLSGTTQTPFNGMQA